MVAGRHRPRARALWCCTAVRLRRRYRRALPELGQRRRGVGAFIDAWRAANEELAEAAAAPATVHTFAVAYPINPLPGPACLHHPEILETPAPIAARLGPPGFALWSDATGTRWHLSTAADSIVLGGPDSSTVQVLEIEPAKGGGFAGIEVGPWSVRSAWLSRAIADAARELEKLPGLTVVRHGGHDV